MPSIILVQNINHLFSKFHSNPAEVTSKHPNFQIILRGICNNLYFRPLHANGVVVNPVFRYRQSAFQSWEGDSRRQLFSPWELVRPVRDQRVAALARELSRHASFARTLTAVLHSRQKVPDRSDDVNILEKGGKVRKL